MFVQLAARALLAPAQQRTDALDQHQPADASEKENVGQRDDEIDLSDGLKNAKDPYAECRSASAADQHHQPQLDVDVLAPPMGKHARYAGGDKLVRLGSDRDGRRHADEDQQRRHQEPAADAEHPRQEADDAAHDEDEQPVDGHFGDGEINLHGLGG